MCDVLRWIFLEFMSVKIRHRIPLFWIDYFDISFHSWQLIISVGSSKEKPSLPPFPFPIRFWISPWRPDDGYKIKDWTHNQYTNKILLHKNTKRYTDNVKCYSLNFSHSPCRKKEWRNHLFVQMSHTYRLPFDPRSGSATTVQSGPGTWRLDEDVMSLWSKLE